MGASQRFWVLPVGIAALVLLLGAAAPAAAGGTGYNLSYTASANSSVLPSVDLVAVSTSYTTGPNLTASLTVAGTPVLNDFAFSYFWLFGGGGTSNSTAWAFVANQTGYLHAPGLGFPGVETIDYTVSGSTLSISVATDLVGPSSGFAFNGEASQGRSASQSTYSFLGTDYQGSGTCNAASCTGTGPGSGSGPATIPIGEILWPIVIVVVVAVLVIVIVRRRRAAVPPPSVPQGPVGGSPPPPPPPPPPSS